MLNFENNAIRQNLIQIRFFSAVVSLIFSIYAIYFDDIINKDGILYLQAAELFISGNADAAFAAYNWPFYSILIALFHKLTSIPLESTAYILNSVFFILLTDALILISSLILSLPRQLKIAAILILCFMPILNYRDYIIRDPGYWAFTCIALYHFMIFLNSSRAIHGMLWQIFMIFAILFRMEGIFLLITLPLFLLLSKKLRGDMVIKKLVSCFFISIILLAVIPFIGDLTTKQFSKIYTIFNYTNFNFLFDKLIFSAEILEHQILNKYSGEYATFILIFGFLSLLIYKIFEGFSISYIVILLASFKNSTQSANTLYRDLFLYFLILNSLILFVFLLKEHFVSSRYIVLTSISLLLLLLFHLVTSIEQLYLKKNKILLAIIFLCLSYNLIDSGTTTRDKSYIKDIALLSVKKVPEKSSVLVNNKAAFYYLKNETANFTVCFEETEQIDMKELNLKKDSCNKGKNFQKYFKSYLHFDYVLLIKKSNNFEDLGNLSDFNLKEVIQTKNLKKDKAVLYKVVK